MEFEGLKGWTSVGRPFNMASRLRQQPRRQQVEWNLFKDSPLKYFEPTCDPTLLFLLLFVRLMLKQVERTPLSFLCIHKDINFGCFTVNGVVLI